MPVYHSDIDVPNTFTVWTDSDAQNSTLCVPFTMPREQRYYWTPSWQNGELAALRELEAGEYVDFDSDDPTDLARWLDEPED